MTGAVAVMAAFVLALGPSPLDAQTGTLTGTITAASTGQPVNGVQVTVEGTNYGSLTIPLVVMWLLVFPLVLIRSRH